MKRKRLNVVVERCEECPRYFRLYSGLYMCELTFKEISITSSIPSWCPLPDDGPPEQEWTDRPMNMANINPDHLGDTKKVIENEPPQ